MTNSTADIKLEFKIFGKVYKTSMRINYDPEFVSGFNTREYFVDLSILQWFDSAYDIALKQKEKGEK